MKVGELQTSCQHVELPTCLEEGSTMGSSAIGQFLKYILLSFLKLLSCLTTEH